MLNDIRGNENGTTLAYVFIMVGILTTLALMLK